MFIDYKVKKYNFKIINAIKKNDIKKIPVYLHHISFYLKENLNNNNFIGGKPGPGGSAEQSNQDELDSGNKISTELNQSLIKLRTLKEHLKTDIAQKEERNLSKIKNIEQTKINEICKTKEEYNKQINRNNLEIEDLKKENQLKLTRINDLEQQLVILQTNNSDQSQQILEEIKQYKLTIDKNILTIEENKKRIEQLERENKEYTTELIKTLEKLKKTEDSRQTNYVVGLNAIKNFRILTQELSTFPGMEETKLLDIFGFSDEKQLGENWGLNDEAAKYVLGNSVKIPTVVEIKD
jgi:hypothetical protein